MRKKSKIVFIYEWVSESIRAICCGCFCVWEKRARKRGRKKTMEKMRWEKKEINLIYEWWFIYWASTTIWALTSSGRISHFNLKLTYICEHVFSSATEVVMRECVREKLVYRDDPAPKKWDWLWLFVIIMVFIMTSLHYWLVALQMSGLVNFTKPYLDHWPGVWFLANNIINV